MTCTAQRATAEEATKSRVWRQGSVHVQRGVAVSPWMSQGRRDKNSLWYRCISQVTLTSKSDVALTLPNIPKVALTLQPCLVRPAPPLAARAPAALRAPAAACAARAAGRARWPAAPWPAGAPQLRQRRAGPRAAAPSSRCVEWEPGPRARAVWQRTARGALAGCAPHRHAPAVPPHLPWPGRPGRLGRRRKRPGRQAGHGAARPPHQLAVAAQPFERRGVRPGQLVEGRRLGAGPLKHPHHNLRRGGGSRPRRTVQQRARCSAQPGQCARWPPWGAPPCWHAAWLCGHSHLPYWQLPPAAPSPGPPHAAPHRARDGEAPCHQACYAGTSRRTVRARTVTPRASAQGSSQVSSCGQGHREGGVSAAVLPGPVLPGPRQAIRPTSTPSIATAAATATAKATNADTNTIAASSIPAAGEPQGRCRNAVRAKRGAGTAVDQPDGQARTGRSEELRLVASRMQARHPRARPRHAWRLTS